MLRRLRLFWDDIDPTAEVRALLRSKKLDRADRNRPVTIDDPELGTFLLERKMGWFTGSGDWAGQAVQLRLWVQEEVEARAILSDVTAFMAAGLDWKEGARRRIADDLLTLANEWIVDAGDREISQQAFLERIRPSEISFFGDGEFEAYFDADDIFGEHGIQVSGNLQSGLHEAIMQ